MQIHAKMHNWNSFGFSFASHTLSGSAAFPAQWLNCRLVAPEVLCGTPSPYETRARCTRSATSNSLREFDLENTTNRSVRGTFRSKALLIYLSKLWIPRPCLFTRRAEGSYNAYLITMNRISQSSKALLIYLSKLWIPRPCLFTRRAEGSPASFESMRAFSFCWTAWLQVLVFLLSYNLDKLPDILGLPVFWTWYIGIYPKYYAPMLTVNNFYSKDLFR